jgi:hypothetical protein
VIPFRNHRRRRRLPLAILIAIAVLAAFILIVADLSAFAFTVSGPRFFGWCGRVRDHRRQSDRPSRSGDGSGYLERRGAQRHRRPPEYPRIGRLADAG